MSFGNATPFGRTNQICFRSSVGSLKYLFLLFAQVSHALVIPLTGYYGLDDLEVPAEDEFSIWLNLTIAAFLVLAGGAFAGLTIALMGQDGVYLQVIATSGEGKQQRHAESVYKLLQKGKHWVLVTLLLSNVIVNETLPIVLDRSLGGGWPAVLGSTVLIVIFGEVIPQSVCVRYGLSIGAFMAPFVLALMWILAPIAWPIAKLLDILLGKDHGTVYKKSGLKTLVTLHKTLGASPTERLNQDEVTIISAVLDLKDKAVGDIMTPIQNVFTMSEDTILDEETMNTILSAGYSRIPIYEPGNPNNFVGMLLVKILITYDPEDCKKVSEFALATLPETRPETSCLDIVNFFQEGKSHMVLVSDFPAENYGAIGVVTLEDVIEELIGEEIIDESDVYIDVHKAIRRLAPAPKARSQKRHVVNSDDVATQTSKKDLLDSNKNLLPRITNGNTKSENSVASTHVVTGPKITLHSRASGAEGNSHITVQRDSSDMRQHLKHLGPSNLASCPKSTRYSTVKIKSLHPHSRSSINETFSASCDEQSTEIISDVIIEEPCKITSEQHNLIELIDEDEGSPDKNTGKDTNISTQRLSQGYGSFGSLKLHEISAPATAIATEGGRTKNHTRFRSSLSLSFSGRTSSYGSEVSEVVNSLNSKSTTSSTTFTRKKRVVQSGSITENIIDAGGIQKLVLEANSSTEELEPVETVNFTHHNEETYKDFEVQHEDYDQGSHDIEGACQALLSNENKRDEVRKKRRKNNRKKKSIP